SFRVVYRHLFVLAIVTCGCASGPPAPRVPVDLSSPATAASTFARAIAAGDAAGARAASVGSDQEKKSIDILVSFIDGLRAYDQAMMNHFGPQAIQVHTQVNQALQDVAEQPVMDLEQPIVSQTGDRARVQPALKGQMKLAGRPAVLVRKTKAGWKVDLAATAQADPRFSPAVTQAYAQAAQALHQTARQVVAGQFKTVEEAQEGAGQ
ncbi:MAG TPA: hypothetical protein VN541_18150, partial [Tepidisphaeraceae bacterium]|nr:hypothetical protein [Tepidisphaeraceae bacterium]